MENNKLLQYFFEPMVSAQGTNWKRNLDYNTSQVQIQRLND